MLIIYLAISFCILIFYIKLAKQYNIIDKPNIRSSHQDITIRGGGIIFPISILIYAAYIGFEYLYFSIGLILISSVSFLDDIYTISNRIRLTIHIIAVSLLFFQLRLFDSPVWVIPVAFILIIGIINAYNFMDGINGITALYSLGIIGSFYLINQFVIAFIDSGYFITLIASLVAFGFFNVRKKAKAFAGDVGSVSIAFIISFLLLKLIIQTQSLWWILLLSVYGIDTVCTIIFRILRHENIFKAHRSHFFQFLANEMKFNHIKVSIWYALVQLGLNFILICSIMGKAFFLPVLSLFLFIIVYLSMRFKFEGKHRLMIKY